MPSIENSLLIIDDDTIVRESIAAYLEDSGFIVYEAGDGEEGLLLYRQYQPDVILCDLKMPKIDGMGVLKEISKTPKRTPVVVISGAGVMGDVVEALRFGATDYLIKPIADMGMLEHAVARCLEYGRLRHENSNYRQRLEEANLELKDSLSALEQDQQAGRHVQFKMLPPTPKRYGNYELSHLIIPSLYLSGDFVDYFTVGEGHVVFFIADVSGHGASSAFVTVLLKNLFARKRSDYIHRADTTVLSPVAMSKLANQELLDTAIGKHLTMCVGVLDLEKNSLLYSNAGHLPQPVLWEGGNAHFLEGDGMPVGLFENPEFNEKSLLLPENFVLSLFSDGILEVLPAEGVVAQEEYLLSKLQAKQQNIDVLTQTFQLGLVEEAPDDIAMLILSRGANV